MRSKKNLPKKMRESRILVVQYVSVSGQNVGMAKSTKSTQYMIWDKRNQQNDAK